MEILGKQIQMKKFQCELTNQVYFLDIENMQYFIVFMISYPKQNNHAYLAFNDTVGRQFVEVGTSAIAPDANAFRGNKFPTNPSVEK